MSKKGTREVNEQEYEGQAVDEIRLSFGPDADQDTFATMFGHLARGYNATVNGEDIEVSEVWQGGEVGIGGFAWAKGDEEEGVATGPYRWWAWGDIETLVVH